MQSGGQVGHRRPGRGGLSAVGAGQEQQVLGELDQPFRLLVRGHERGVQFGVLRTAHGDQFFTDAPVTVFPVSWQDTGSGVFTLAAASLGYGLGPLAAQPARTSIRYALLAAVAALLVDIYLY